MYAAPPICATRPAMDAIFTIVPLPRSIIAGKTRLVILKIAFMLISNIKSHCCSVVSKLFVYLSKIPALFIRISIGPNVSTAVFTIFSRSALTVTFTLTASACPPFSLISLTTASAPSRFKSATTTFAPSFAKRIASAFPIPEAAPVIIVTLSCNLIVLFLQTECDIIMMYCFREETIITCLQLWRYD